MYVGMSEVHRERDDLPSATQQLLWSQELGEHAGLPQNRYRWRVAMARIRQAEGDLGGALDLLNEAERRDGPAGRPDLAGGRAAGQPATPGAGQRNRLAAFRGPPAEPEQTL